ISAAVTIFMAIVSGGLLVVRRWPRTSTWGVFSKPDCVPPESRSLHSARFPRSGRDDRAYCSRVHSRTLAYVREVQRGRMLRTKSEASASPTTNGQRPTIKLLLLPRAQCLHFAVL